MPLDLDPRYSFENFIVGSANRLAAAAARRVAEAPGSAYNPLFIYSASGLGKTHLVNAIGAQIRRVHPQLQVMYDTLEHLMDEVLSAMQAGAHDAFRQQLRNVAVLLLDDVQFVAGRRSAQEELLRAWDGLLGRGGQVVLASDRPPAEIDGLDDRLLSRFSGGLITDVGTPDYETRVAIVTKKVQEHGLSLGAGVAQALARVAVANVRELQGALNRVMAAQELEGRAVAAEDVARLLGAREIAPGAADEFDSYLSEIATTLDDVMAQLSPEQLAANAIARWQAEGYRTARLEVGLAGGADQAAVESLISDYEQDIARLLETVEIIQSLDPDAPELDRSDVLRNPDRLADAEVLLEQVRERTAPLPEPPPSPRFEELTLGEELLPVRAARAVAGSPGERYNPLYVHGPSEAGKTGLLIALAAEVRTQYPDWPLAFITGEAFASELISAMARHQLDSWRARYRRARVLVIDDVDALVDTERAQEELFHLYDAVSRDGGQLVFSASCPPRELRGLEDRLRSRLESGLVVELAAPVASEAGEAGVTAGAAEPALVELAPTGETEVTGRNAADWLLGSDKVLWRWPYLQDTLVADLD